MPSSPTARALEALFLLQERPGVTAAGLAERLGVSERAARQYVRVLREAGVPVASVRGRHGGYRLGRGLRLPPVVFSAAEALALVMAVLDGHHATRSDQDDDLVGRALDTLLRALPERVAAQAESVRRTARAAPDRGAARPAPETVAALVEACAERRRVRFTYTSEGGRTADRDVDPWGVVVRHGRWYLLCAAPSGRRAYRLDRMGEVRSGGPGDGAPEGLDPVAELTEHLASGWSMATEVHVEAPPDVVRRGLPAALGRVEPLGATGEGFWITGTTDDPWWYAEQLVRLPAAFTVVGGEELRATTTALGRRLLASVGDA
ncbi:YafY family protein [Nocardioides sp. CFH 31398]|uniref:helix-turn-helix transcriptional regulator n=1 Tax=Nocardioides sp. CFH 31398 TaxID=2919579 RepID=UPI001F06475B|nr:WYL domain-containing protein [Nocardioides sp. CFH 31398]MCH1867107.1 WYL domain-containing protein [Nocardioides sp. CFH 31398]